VKFSGLSIFAVVIAFASQASAWGPIGHELIATVGARTTSNAAGWTASSNSIKSLSTVPDRRWKDPSTKPIEGYQHWFEIDAYPGVAQNPDAILNIPKAYADAVSKFSQPTVAKNGTAPWRINQFYELLVSSLKSHDFKSAVEYAGIMSHYVADLSQPFHVTQNYDGQMTGNTGIHGWFETKILENQKSLYQDVQQMTVTLLKDADFLKDNSGDVKDIAFHEAIRALEPVQEILQNDNRLGRNSPNAVQTQLEIAKRCLADGAATYAIILARAEAEAGVKLPNTQFNVGDPSFIQPNLE